MPELAVLPDVQVDVRVAAHVAFLEVAVRHLHVAQDFLHGLHEEGCFLRAGHVRLGDDFDQRRARTVVVDVGVLARQVERLADVLFQVDAFHADAAVLAVFKDAVLSDEVGGAELRAALPLVLRVLRHGQVDVAVRAEGNVILGYLVALGQVGVEVVLAVELGEAGDVAVQGQPGDRAELHVALAYAGHRTGKSQAHGADPGVRHAAVSVLTGTECLRLSQKLGMDLTAYHDFPLVYCHRPILPHLHKKDNKSRAGAGGTARASRFPRSAFLRSCIVFLLLL